jgi:hypothetical protein
MVCPSRGDNLYRFQINLTIRTTASPTNLFCPIEELTVTFKAMNERPNFSLTQAEEFGSFI